MMAKKRHEDDIEMTCHTMQQEVKKEMWYRIKNGQKKLAGVVWKIKRHGESNTVTGPEGKEIKIPGETYDECIDYLE